MANPAKGLGVCPVCRKGRLVLAERVRAFAPHGRRVEVKLQTSRCDACGETTTSAAQHRENLRVLAERKVHYGKLLMGEEILALRKRYGLRQQDASRIFGKGKIAFSRYENEATYPDDSTTLLLQLAIEKPSVLKALANKAGVELPLWPERCEDEQRVKLRALPRNITAAAAGTKQLDRYTASLKTGALGGMARAALSTHPVPRRHTITLPEASNDGRIDREAVAS
jgi:putative zinc finger/helix-turn-helix YgiT family protein